MVLGSVAAISQGDRHGQRWSRPDADPDRRQRATGSRHHGHGRCIGLRLRRAGVLRRLGQPATRDRGGRAAVRSARPLCLVVNADAESMIGFCRQRLAGYKVPRQISFVDACRATRWTRWRSPVSSVCCRGRRLILKSPMASAAAWHPAGGFRGCFFASASPALRYWTGGASASSASR